MSRAPSRLRLAGLLLWLPALACTAPDRGRRDLPPPLGPREISAFRLGESRHVLASGDEPSQLAVSANTTNDGARLLGDPTRPLGRPRPAEAEALTLGELLRSVESHFPLVLAAMEQVEIAAGETLAAEGGFDTQLKAKGKFELEGFYDSDRFDVMVEQPTALWGATIEGGYRRGDGSFAVYDGKAKTNLGGEYRLGATLPVLQGGRVDSRRVELWKARLAAEQAGPQVEAKRIEATRKAAEVFWKWVAWGEKLRIAQGLLSLADDRQRQLQRAVELGQQAPIVLVDNQRLIVDRRAQLLEVEQGLQEAAIQLSLFWRDVTGQPQVPGPDWLPDGFPVPRPPDDVLVPDDVELALQRRPDLREVDLELERLRLDRELADNDLLPRLDVGLFGSQDEGRAVNTPDDKGDFELEAVVRFAVPLQRRKPRGTLRKAEAKLAKLEQERRYLADLVVSQVQSAVTAISRTWQRLDQARINVRLARTLEQAERTELELGESDLLRVNLRESQTAKAASGLVDVLAEHHLALAGYRAVLGLPYDEVLRGEPVGGTGVDG